MSRLDTKLRTLALAATLGCAMLAAPAFAQQAVQVRDGNGSNVFSGGPGSQNVSIKVNGSDLNVAAGAFALQYRFNTADAWTNFLTYCLEPDENLGISGSTIYNGSFYADIGATPEYGSVAADLARLNARWFADSLTTAVKSAAFQVALWEIAYDTGRNLGAGLFRLNTNGAVLTQAQAYLDAANWPGSGNLGVILRVGNQDLIVQVPEPATLGLLGLGLLGLGALRRARRQG
jgi:hypothetical protein